jgi:hypothetical protein
LGYEPLIITIGRNSLICPSNDSSRVISQEIPPNNKPERTLDKLSNAYCGQYLYGWPQNYRNRSRYLLIPLPPFQLTGVPEPFCLVLAVRKSTM